MGSSMKWPRIVVKLNDEKPRTFATFEKAEKYARDRIRDECGGSAAISRANDAHDIAHDFMHPLAVVSIDALDRVWTDMRR